MLGDLLSGSALEQARAVHDGDVSATELVEAALHAGEDVQSRLGAFTVLDGDRALEAARKIGPHDPRPFAGVPFAVKDLAMATKYLPLTKAGRSCTDRFDTPRADPSAPLHQDRGEPLDRALKP